MLFIKFTYSSLVGVAVSVFNADLPVTGWSLGLGQQDKFFDKKFVITARGIEIGWSVSRPYLRKHVNIYSNYNQEISTLNYTYN